LSVEDRIIKTTPYSYQKSDIVLDEVPFYLILLHEMTHVYHMNEDYVLFLQQSDQVDPIDGFPDCQDYGDHEELVTITGWNKVPVFKEETKSLEELANEEWEVDDENLGTPWNSISENGFRSLYNLRPRLGHEGIGEFINLEGASPSAIKNALRSLLKSNQPQALENLWVLGWKDHVDSPEDYLSVVLVEAINDNNIEAVKKLIDLSFKIYPRAIIKGAILGRSEEVLSYLKDTAKKESIEQ
jgi:hypothetical protein